MSWKIGDLMPERLKPHKISWKIALIYAAIFSAVLIALNAGTLFGVRFFLTEQARSQVAAASADTLNLLVSGRSVRLSDPAALREANSSPEIGIRITDAAGKTVSSLGGSAADSLSAESDPGEISVFERGDRHIAVENSRIEKDGRLYGYLQVSYDMHAEYRFIKLLFAFTAFAVALGILISLGAGHVVSRRTLKPIDSMTRTAQEISSGDLRNRVEVGAADDELTRLAVTLNRMIERLQISFEKQTQFVSDASHELRTPIAVIQGYADMIDRWGKDDPKVLAESMAAIRKETKGMAGLIEELLFLARGDSDKIRLQKTEFGLGGLMEEIAAESRLIAPSHRFTCKAERIALYADRRLVKQALRALVENSVKYTPAGGDIFLTASAGKDRAVIEVRDTGAGIPAEDLPKLFDRFYRVDKGRSKEKGGSGLGLSIVKWIAEAHEGAVGAESVPGKGTAVKIELPLPKAK